MLDQLLQKNEGKTLEFKENAQTLHNIIKTVIAFGNTAGGTIIIGIKNASKEILGIQDPLKEEERLTNSISELIAPAIMPDIEIQSIRNKEIILIKVHHGVGPYYLKSLGPDKGIYIRLGSTNRIADNETVYRLRLFTNNISPDEVPYLQKGAEILDRNVIKSEFKKVNKIIDDHKLHLLGVLTEHQGKLLPSMGGILLFGKNKQLVYPDAMIQCAQFAGTDKVTFLDQDDIHSYLPIALEQAISFIKKHTKIGAIIGPVRRKDIPQYPPEAIREAVTNAILHADYDMKGSSISIAIFEDRIEITNPGGLHFGMTLENALTGASKLRNKVIGRAFRELKLIERWGSGLKRIVESCRKYGLKPPLFEELNNQFRVTLYCTKFKTTPISKTRSKHKASGLYHWEKIIIDYLKEHKEIGTKKAAKLWKITARAARDKLKRMVDRGILYKIATSPKDPQAVYMLMESK